jgi:hypothetical protein
MRSATWWGLLAAALLGVGRAADADMIITFDDTSAGLPVQVGVAGTSNFIRLAHTTGGRATLLDVLPQPAPWSIERDYVLLGPLPPGGGPQPIHDWVRFIELEGKTRLLILFRSEGDPEHVPPARKIYGTAPWTGGWQSIPLPTGLPGLATAVTVRIATAPGAVPEPSTLLPAGMGLLLALGAARRRQKSAS